MELSRVYGTIATYDTSGTIQFLSDGSFHVIYSQLGGTSWNKAEVGYYSLQGDVLTLTTNGQHTNERIQVIDADTFKIYNPNGSVQSLTRSS
jgi:hypothetical protein